MNTQDFQTTVLEKLDQHSNSFDQQKSFNQTVLEKLNEQSKILNQQETFNSFLAKQMHIMQGDISELKTDVSELKYDVTHLKSDVVEMKEDILDLKDQGNRLEVLTENHMREQVELIQDGSRMYTDVQIDKHVVALHS